MGKYKINFDFFKTWTIESAYVFGFISADGSVTHRKNNKTSEYKPVGASIKLHQKDTQILEHIKELMEFDGPLTYNAGKDGNQTLLMISKTSIAKDLIQLGLMKDKSYELKWPDNIPSEFMPHYLAGLFDGDGSVFYKQDGNPNFKSLGINLTGTHDICQGLKDYFSSIYQKSIGHIQNHGTYAAYVLNGIHSAMFFLDHIYENSTPNTRLERKYQKYLDYKNNEYPEYIKYLELSISNMSTVDYNTAETIRQLRDDGYTYNQISKQFNIQRDVVAAIIEGITHTKKDNRTGHSTCYIHAFGETRHILDWMDHEKCVVSEHTLYDRLFKSKTDWTSEDAISTPPDYTLGTLKYSVEAFGETKTLTQWLEDPRCKVSRATIMRRIGVLGMTPEEALTAEDVVPRKPIYKNGKIAGNQKTSLDDVKKIRELSVNIPVREIAEELNLPLGRVRDIASNRSFNDGTLDIISNKSDVILININGHNLTIKQISDSYNIPYQTIDRWYRDNLNVWKMIQERTSGKTRINLGKAKSQKEIDSDNLAFKVRQDYKDGIVGKKLLEKYTDLKKSRIADIISNRTNKVEEIWWK